MHVVTNTGCTILGNIHSSGTGHVICVYQLETEEMTDIRTLTDINAETEIGSLFESFSAQMK